METQTAPVEEPVVAPPVEEPQLTEKQIFIKKLLKETSMHKKYAMLLEYCEKYDLPKGAEYVKHINPSEQDSATLRRYWPIATRVVDSEEKPRIVDNDFETKPISIPLLHLWVSQGTAIYLDTSHPQVLELNKKVKKKVLKVTKLEPDKEKKQVTLIATDLKDNEYEIVLTTQTVPSLWFRFIDYPGTEKYAAFPEMKQDYQKRMEILNKDIKSSPYDKEAIKEGVQRVKI